MLSFLLTVTGCGVSTSTFSGIVRLNENPISDCKVIFLPKEGGIASTGITDTEGYFVLQTVEAKPSAGVVPGEYTVLFCWNSPADAETNSIKPPYNIPVHYSNKGISFTVPKGNQNKVVFDLIP
jgi:hypothetical protein